MHVDVAVSSPVHESFRVQQVAGMFDLPLAESTTERFQVELPSTGADWQIGLIVGPSGSGKTTVARQAFADAYYSGSAWPEDRAVVDAISGVGVRKVIDAFTAVGFSSPPSWLKLYDVLSGGERFRCDLARALLEGGLRSEAGDQGLVVFDEFTSVVDRNVAKVCAAAVAKSIRRGTLPGKFVAVTCHYDVAEWLEADWILDMATCRLERRRLRRPNIELEIHRSSLEAWELFRRHHYLNHDIHRSAQAYLVTWDGNPVHFSATLPMLMRKNRRRFTRVVTLPDFQGLGIGMKSMEAVAELHCQEGLRINVTSSHPCLIGHCRRSQRWKVVGVKKYGSTHSRVSRQLGYQSSAGRAVVSFEYLGNSIAA